MDVVKDRLWAVGKRLHGQAIRREHDMAEAIIHAEWWEAEQHRCAAKELRGEANAVMSAAVTE